MELTTVENLKRKQLLTTDVENLTKSITSPKGVLPSLQKYMPATDIELENMENTDKQTLLKETKAESMPADFYYSVHVAPRLLQKQDVETAFVSMRPPPTDKRKEGSAGSTSTTSSTNQELSEQQRNEENPKVCGTSSVHPLGALHCIVTMQPVTDALISFSDDGAFMKDLGREYFFDFMNKLQVGLEAKLGIVEKKAEEQGKGDKEQEEVAAPSSSSSSSGGNFIIDWPDPATGIPMNGECGPSIYTELDGLEQMTNYEVIYVCGPGGGCKVVTHPSFGTSVYPSTGFVIGPTDVILEVLKDL